MVEYRVLAKYAHVMCQNHLTVETEPIFFLQLRMSSVPRYFYLFRNGGLEAGIVTGLKEL